MLLRTVLFVFTAFLAFGDDDPWAKMRDIKSGTELRVYRKGTPQPLIVKMDEATDESLRVVDKNRQMAIPRQQIDRVDYRPAKPGSRIMKESKTTINEPPDAKTPTVGPTRGGAPSSSSSTSFSIAPKPDFETIYRRPPAVPKK